MLLEVGKRLGTSIRASDTAARFGGDEFAVLLEGVESAQEAADTAERIIESLAVPLSVEHKELVMRASMGISMVAGELATDAEEMIRNADAAMYIAKRDGKGGYRLFEPAMHEGVLARLELRADLQRAITNNQFELHYQPVVALGTARGVGRRGAAALAPPRARPRPAGPVHPVRRGDRPDRPDRPLGAARGVPPGRAACSACCRATRR